MTVVEAKKILQDYYDLTNPNEQERFLYVEALDFLIHETKNDRYMTELGGYYYEGKQFDLARKYYELAAEYDNIYALQGLGYIWYYGRTGERDYEKAFYYYDRARQKGSIIAAYKVADMYKNGYYVEKDEKKYREIIESLYPRVRRARDLYDPLPEIFTRLARIRTEEGRIDEALRLYDQARDFQSQRIRLDPFFGDLNIMKWMIEDIYRLRAFDKNFFALYDLYYLLLRPGKVRFSFEGEPHTVEAVEEDGQLSVRMDDSWYRTVDDFFQKAELGGEHITTLYDELLDFEVIE